MHGGPEQYLKKDGYMFPVSCMGYTVHWHPSKRPHDSRPGGGIPLLTSRKADYNDASLNREAQVPAPGTMPTIDDRVTSERLAAHVVSRVLVCDSGFAIVYQ